MQKGDIPIMLPLKVNHLITYYLQHFKLLLKRKENKLYTRILEKNN